MAVLDKLFCYPVKSLGPLQRHRSEVEENGLMWDRHWMLADEEGNFISQRRFPELNLLRVGELEGEFMITDPEHNFVLIPKALGSDPGESVSFHVKLWSSDFDAEIWNPNASQWFSDYLNHRVILVGRIPGQRIRLSDSGEKHLQSSFADGYPVHLVNLESVSTLSEWCGEEIDALQFRPNVLLRDMPAFEEDRLAAFTIGTQRFEIIKPCDRCIMTTIKPHTSAIGTEPLTTLSRRRREGNKVHFGMYAMPVPDQQGIFDHVSLNQELKLEFR